MCQQYFFLRHAEVVQEGILLGQGIDPPLSDSGRATARRWGEVLQAVPFQAVITSPARRARETGEYICPSGVPFLQLPHFHEVSWGVWEGRPLPEVESLLRREADAWAQGEVDYAPSGGESLRQLLQRASEGLRLVASLYPTGSVLIITHGQLLRLLLAHLMGYPIASQHTFYHRRGQLSWLVRLPAGHFYLRALAVDADTAF